MVRGQHHAPAALYPQERPGTHFTGGWVGPRAGLDRCGKSRPPTGIRASDRPARSQSIYRLSYRAHDIHMTCKIFVLKLFVISLHFKCFFEILFENFVFLTPHLHICQSINHYSIASLETSLRMVVMRPKHAASTSYSDKISFVLDC